MGPIPSTPEQKPFVAFSGRSNVGKSSVINWLLGRRVARVSQTPGCTQQIYFYPAQEGWVWVDLPGYGYAQASQKARMEWQAAVRQLIQRERPLTCVIIDSRIPPQRLDLVWINWLLQESIPFVLLANKIDAISQKEFFRQKTLFSEVFPAPLYWGWISAKTGAGLMEFQQWVRRYLDL